MKQIDIKNISLNLSVGVPGSKSIGNRLLLLQKTSGVPVTITNLSTADDSRLLSDLLSCIETVSSSDSNPVFLSCNNCGTAYRFLTAYLACTRGTWILDGNERMRLRPIKALTDTLTDVGAEIKYIHQSGFPPLQIKGKQLSAAYWKINSQQSSQYVSAIAMILPLLRRNAVIEFSPDTASLQYIDMTIQLMQMTGLSILRTNHIIRYIHEDKIKVPVTFFVEYDWSAAAVWFVFAAFASRARIFISGLQKSKLQADNVIVEWMELFGVKAIYTDNGVVVVKTKQKMPDILQLNCKNNPDLVPCLASLCVGLRIKGRLEGVENLSIKESNRINALAMELGKIASVHYHDHILTIEPNENEFPETVYFSSHNDHRIAMALSVLSFCIDNLHIDHPECVSKSYPEYWENFAKINQ